MPIVSSLRFPSSNVFLDSSGKIWTPYGIVNADASDRISGNPSGYFNGSGSYLRALTNADFDLGQDLTSSITVQFWFKSNSGRAAMAIYNDRYEQPNSGRGWAIFINRTSNDGKICWWSGCGQAGNYLDLSTTIGGLTNNYWHHVKLVRLGTSYKVFVDYILRAETTYSQNPYPGQNPCIGRDLYYASAGQQDFIGKLCGFTIIQDEAILSPNALDNLPYCMFGSPLPLYEGMATFAPRITMIL